MAKRTVLDMVQGILNELVSDEVNSISDTPEAMIVASLIRECYYNISEEMDLPSERVLRTLDPVSNSATPNFLTIPDNVSQVMWIKYDSRIDNADNKNYADVVWMAPADFVNLVTPRPSTDTDNYLMVPISTGVNLPIFTKSAPHYWTSFDDKTLVFDSYNTDVDSTLQASKSLAYVEQTSVLTLTNTAMPALPENLFPLLYSQALARATLVLRQQPNQTAERDTNRMRVRSQRNKWAQGRVLTDEPNYGR